MFRFSNNDKWTCQWKKKGCGMKPTLHYIKPEGMKSPFGGINMNSFFVTKENWIHLERRSHFTPGPAPDRPAGLSIHAPLSTPQDIFRRGTWYWAQHIFSGGTNDQQPSSAHSRLELCPKPLRWSLTHHSFLYLYKISYAYVSFCTIGFSVTLP